MNTRKSGGWGADLKVATAFLTRLPLRFESLPPPLAQAAHAFPIVGAGVGIAGGLVLLAAAFIGLPPLVCAFLALGVQVFVTGGLHEDGLADTADGIGGGRDKESCLEIMRDSRIGSYGVLALIFFIGIKAGALSGYVGPGLGFFALVAAGAASRSFLPVVMLMLPPARTDGLGQGAGRPPALAAALALIIGWLLVMASLIPVVGLPFAFAAWGAAALGALVPVWLAWRRIGGFTGDVLGASQQTAEVFLILLLAAWI